jgi:hypothetical protein
MEENLDWTMINKSEGIMTPVELLKEAKKELLEYSK